MSLFGSYARGEANNDSDVDLYIGRSRLKSLIQYFAFIDELENGLDCHVDIVTTGIEDKTFLSKIMQEGVLLKEYIEERAIQIANYIIENNATVRQTAKEFGISKSMVHTEATK